MYLKAENYIEPEASSSTLTELEKSDIKNKIKALVPSGKKLYKEVIDSVEADYIEQGKHLKSDDILAIVKEVELEWHPVVVEEVVKKV